MVWKVILHPEVEGDLRSLGKADAQKIVKVLQGRIALGEPDKLGKPLSRQLAGYRRVRTGHLRIVYKVDGSKIQVFVIAAGLRRDDEIYNIAVSRLQ
jgi:mRNA interferase RelE/StbE